MTLVEESQFRQKYVTLGPFLRQATEIFFTFIRQTNFEKTNQKPNRNVDASYDNHFL